MTTKVKFKGSKRLARRAAERQAKGAQTNRTSQAFQPSRFGQREVASQRYFSTEAGRLVDVSKLTNILEARTKKKPFYDHLYWTEENGNAVKITQMGETHLLSAIEMLRKRRELFLQTAAKQLTPAAQHQSYLKAALTCGWIVCLEDAAEKKIKGYPNFRQKQGRAMIVPTSGEIAAFPSLFLGA